MATKSCLRAAPGTTASVTPQQALARAVAHLRGLQSEAGFWKGELETNVTMDAEDLLLREFLGIRGEQETAEAARWIRSRQRPDGTWATFYGGPPDLSTTVEAWVALRLAGDDPDAPWMSAAGAYVRAEGGVAATRVFTRIWLALFGLWSWDELPVMPPEMVLLPPRAPLNIYNWACWARQTIVPLTVVAAARPVRPLPFDIAPLRAVASPAKPTRRPQLGPGFRISGYRAQGVHATTGASAPHPSDETRPRVGAGPPRGRRVMGGHPTAVGLLVAGPARVGIPAGPSSDAGGTRRTRGVHHP